MKLKRFMSFLKKHEKAEKVFIQIYQYMNEHNAYYEYIIMNRELICIRRMGTEYGARDISRSIPISAEIGEFNARLALWYFHHKYIISDSEQSKMQYTPQNDKIWMRHVREIQHQRLKRFEQNLKDQRISKSSLIRLRICSLYH